jgi:ectoine hydroxylase-related dioxygenase (phytanoyl-CoA dioxygenase family)
MVPSTLPSLPPVPAAQAAQLREVGFVVVRNFLPVPTLDELESVVHELGALEGAAAGSEFRQEEGVGRLAALVGKHAAFARLVADPAVLRWPAHVLGGHDRFKLSSLNARSVPPAADGAASAGAQALHSDMMSVEDDAGPWVCNVLIALAPYDATTGPLRVVPRSFGWRQLPADGMADPRARHPDEVLVTAARGDAIVMNAHRPPRHFRPRILVHGLETSLLREVYMYGAAPRVLLRG